MKSPCIFEKMIPRDAEGLSPSFKIFRLHPLQLFTLFSFRFNPFSSFFPPSFSFSFFLSFFLSFIIILLPPFFSLTAGKFEGGEFQIILGWSVFFAQWHVLMYFTTTSLNKKSVPSLFPRTTTSSSSSSSSFLVRLEKIKLNSH